MNGDKIIVSDCKNMPDYSSKVTSEVQLLTNQRAVTSDTIKCGPVVVKLPVVLAEVNVTIPVEATITLDREVSEIKRIRKNVFLSESRIIPFSEDKYGENGILFVEGFIKKNIEYATKTYSSDGTPNTCGYIRYCTVEVPFNFTTRINFIREPIFIGNSIPCEVEFFTDKVKDCDECKDAVIGNSLCEKCSAFTEIFNEKPFAELVKVDIIEIDININETLNCTAQTEQIFSKVTEKLVLNLTIRILQKQQIRITAL